MNGNEESKVNSMMEAMVTHTIRLGAIEYHGRNDSGDTGKRLKADGNRSRKNST